MPEATLIKARHARSAGSLVSFTFQDVEEQAQRIIADAHAEAERMLADARQEIDELRESERRVVAERARNEGFTQGYEEGLRKGHEEGRAAGTEQGRDAFVDAAAPAGEALHALLSELEHHHAALRQDAEQELLELAVAIARRVVKHAFEVHPHAVADQVRELLTLAADRHRVVVSVHPQDFEVVSDTLPALRSLFADLGEISVSADDTLSRGSARLRTDNGLVELNIEEALDQLAVGILGTPGERGQA